MKLFKQSHLKEVNETYFEHMAQAHRYGFKMIFAGLACILHGLIPNLFVTTGSDTMRCLLQEINQRTTKNAA